MGFYQKYIIHVDSKLYCGAKNYLISHTWKEKHSSGILGVDLSIAILIVVHSLAAFVICKKEMTDNIRFNRMQGKYNYTGCVCNLRGAHLKHVAFYKHGRLTELNARIPKQVHSGSSASASMGSG
jgi:hypothetical protein